MNWGDVMGRILSWYPAMTDGQKKKLRRIFEFGTTGMSGKLVILPVDQGFEHGPNRTFEPNPAGYSPIYHAQLAINAGCSAYAAPLGAVEAAQSYIANRTEFTAKLPMILKVNSNDLMMPTRTDPFPAVTSWVDDAVRLNCVAVGFTIYPGSLHAREMYQQLRELVADARKSDLVVVVWAYPRGSGLPGKEAETALDVSCYGVHLACQLGAHIVKCKPASNVIYGLPDNEKRRVFPKVIMEFLEASLAERTKMVLKSAFDGRRIVIFSGGEAKTEEAVLAEVKELAQGGAFGSIMGRNAFQRPMEEAKLLLGKAQKIYLDEAAKAF